MGSQQNGNGSGEGNGSGAGNGEGAGAGNGNGSGAGNGGDGGNGSGSGTSTTSTVDLTTLDQAQLEKVLENPNLFNLPRIKELRDQAAEGKRLKDEAAKADEKH